MITENTVFILGAGASKPYGFPTALELRKDIIRNFSKQYHNKLIEDRRLSHSEKAPIENDIKELIDTFKLSSTKSIDLFLSRNKKYYGLGKAIIAFLIASYEVKSKFREETSKPEEDWYFEIFDILTREISDPEKLTEMFIQNKISFITFNYDRSFEHFLYTSLLNSFATKRNDIKGIMINLKIIHLYGQIDPLDWQVNYPALSYGNPDFFGRIDEFVKNIKIIFEERNPDVREARSLIKNAKNIFFLGFGFADENLAALEFSSLLNKQHHIYGTGLGLTESERRKIISKLIRGNSLVHSEFITIEDCDSVMLLRKYL